MFEVIAKGTGINNVCKHKGQDRSTRKEGLQEPYEEGSRKGEDQSWRRQEVSNVVVTITPNVY